MTTNATDDTLAAALLRAEQLQTACNRQVQALEFYGRPENWQDGAGTGPGCAAACVADAGGGGAAGAGPERDGVGRWAMISWHKVEQKVVCRHRGNPLDELFSLPSPLVVGQVYTVREVQLDETDGDVGFVLLERPDDEWFDAELFEPVYPIIIEKLRTLPSLTPDRVKEDA